MKKYLVLEDNADFAQSYKMRLSGIADVVAVDNLVTFDERLFDYPGLDVFDKVIVDLAIPLGDLSMDDLLGELPQMSPNVTMLNGKIPLLGWDYFYNKIMQNKVCRQNMNKFVIISGHVTLFMEYLKKNKINLQTKIIDKADPDLARKLVSL